MQRQRLILALIVVFGNCSDYGAGSNCQFSLGLDLQGGAQLTIQVKTDARD
jgi:preprotein translocase subunit SecD